MKEKMANKKMIKVVAASMMAVSVLSVSVLPQSSSANVLSQLSPTVKSEKAGTSMMAEPKLWSSMLPTVGEKVEENFDVSKGWEVEDYNSDLGIDIDKVFRQGMSNPDGTMNYATINFGNIGNANFIAKKTIKMKKNHEYKLNLNYGIRLSAGVVGSIDFNGTKKDVSVSGNPAYEETIVAKEDMDYVITMEFTTPMETTAYLMVGYNPQLGDGITESADVKPPTVIAPEANQNIVKGAGEPGSRIIVKDSSGIELGSGAVQANKSFSIETSRDLIFGEFLSVTQVDATGFESQPTVVKVVDTIGPEIDSVDSVEAGQNLVEGQTEARAVVRVYEEDGTTLLGTSDAADTTGHFTVKLVRDAVYQEKLVLSVTDSAGNLGSSMTTEVVDTTAPNKPTIAPITDNDTILTGTAEADSTITVKVGHQLFTGTADSLGDYTIDLAQTFPGGTIIDVTATDIAGNISESESVVVKLTKPTAVPVVNPLTDQESILTGTTEPGATVEAHINKDIYKTTATASGTFEIQLNHKYIGGTDIVVTATGISGVISAEYQGKVLDQTAPDKPEVNEITDNDAVITGTAEPDSVIDIYTEVSPQVNAHYQGVANDKGDFSVAIDKLPVNTKVGVFATDSYGNISERTNVVVVSSTSVSVTINKITSQQTVLTGSTLRGNAQVEVLIGSRLYQDMSDDKGNYSIKLDHAYVAGTEITVTATEGTNTDTKSIKVSPRKVSITSAFAGSATISGVADPLAEVHIAINDQPMSAPVTSDANGNYSVTLAKPLALGDKITSYQVLNGETSESQDRKSVV